MMKFGRSILFLFLCTALWQAANALDPGTRISQYAHTAWRVQDGAFSGAPNAIAQTSDGYLWIGTDGGLVRFDGVRFVSWSSPNGKHLSDPRVDSLLGARDGTLWIGTFAGPVHWTGENLIEFPKTGGRINSFIEDHDGAVWMTRSRVHDGSGPLCRAISNVITCYANHDGISVPYAGPLAMDKDGYIWMGSPSVLSRWKPGSFVAYMPQKLEKAENLTGVNGLAIMPDSSLWVGIQRAGPGLGLERFAGEHWLRFVTTDFDGSKLEVTTLFLDRENSLWVGTAKDGIYRIHNNAVDHFQHADGLSGDSVNCFYQDAEGTLWVATSRGIDSFHDLPIITFSTAEGLGSDRAGSVLAARDGTIWIGTSGSLDSIRDGKVSSIRPDKGLPGTRVTALLEDHAGRLWVGIDNGLWIYEKGRFRPVTVGDKPIGTTIAIVEDAIGNVWADIVGNSRRLVRIRDGQVQEEAPSTRILAQSFVSDRAGLWLVLSNGDLARYQDGHFKSYSIKTGRDSKEIRSIYLDIDGGVWGVTEAGLIRWQNGRAKTLNVQNGYSTQRTYSLIVDAEQALWAYTAAGLLRITRKELNRWWDNPDAPIEMTRFDVFDGAQPSAASFRPKSTRSPDGRLWFANDNVVQVVDPSRIKSNLVPPPVKIEEIIADRKVYAIQKDLHLPALTRDLEIDYTGLSFIAPQKVRFRYMLEGRDKSWQEVGARRQAFYSDLRPGKYRFRVMASNADGVWSVSGAAMEFSVSPDFYQRPWFRFFCVIAALALLWLLYRLRLRQIGKALNERFEERIAERTRLARELHDTLLQTLQGSKLFADTSLRRSSDATTMRDTVVSLSGWLERAITEVRASLNSLRASSQEDDLREALLRAAEGCRQSASMHLNFEAVGPVEDTEPKMHPITREEIFRIGYEAILNACRHSQASMLEVKISYLPDFHLSIHDDGQGMDPGIAAHGKSSHFGLQGMRERARRINGVLTVVSEIGVGTKVELVLPAKIVFPRRNWKTFLKKAGLVLRPTDEIPY